MVNEVLLCNERYHIAKLRSFAEHHSIIHCYDFGALVKRTVSCIVLYTKNVKLINLFVDSVRASSIHNAVLNLYFGKLGSNKLSTRWPSGLRRWSAAARLLRLWIRSHRKHGCLSVVSVVGC